MFWRWFGGAVEKDTDILEMWNEAIAAMSADGTTAEITKSGLVETFLCSKYNLTKAVQIKTAFFIKKQ